MAEFIDLRKERMLPEYEQMRTLNLFKDEEITKMKKARDAFEHRIAQPTRNIRDYLEYLKYERGLVSLTKERAKLHKCSGNNSINKLIGNRMKQLYIQALAKFPHDTRFWDEYLKFLSQFKFTTDISATFERMLGFHSDKPDVWTRAILWEYNENYEDHRVKGLLLRAQQRHPESQRLYLTFFQIELENKRKSEEATALQHAEVVYTNGKKKFATIEFYIEMLKIVDKFDYAKSIQNQILDDMRQLFPKSELLWHTLAQRELNGLSYSDASSKIDLTTDSVKCEDVTMINATGETATAAVTASTSKASTSKASTSKASTSTASTSNTSIPTASTSTAAEPVASTSTADINKDAVPAQHTLKKRIELCVQIYDQAVKQLNTTKMWDYYINAMLALNSDKSTQASLKRSSLSRAFKAAHDSNNMSEPHYLQYIELLYSMKPKDETIPKILLKATKIYKTSAKIWMQCLRYYIHKNDPDKVKSVFVNAKSNLSTDSADIWLIYLIFIKTSPPEPQNKEFPALITELSQIAHPKFNLLKSKVIELLATTQSIKHARKAYQMFVRHFASCLEVHETMAELESKQMKRDIKQERLCLTLLVTHFGRHRTDVWLRFMKFERSFGDPKDVGKIYDRALINLDPELQDDFQSLHNLFINGVV